MKSDLPSVKDRVSHVIEAIDNIQSFIKMHTRESFQEDTRTISACLYQFTMIGEATRHIDMEILERYTYPWHKVKSFRNFILHEYFGIQIKLVWDTAITTLPELREMMVNILFREFKE